MENISWIVWYSWEVQMMNSSKDQDKILLILQIIIKGLIAITKQNIQFAASIVDEMEAVFNENNTSIDARNEEVEVPMIDTTTIDSTCT